MKLNVLFFCGLLATVPIVASAAVEASDDLTITAPDFLIPLGGQSGTLDVFFDGRAPEASGFNVLGNQKVFVRANTESVGMVTLNLHLPGFIATDPDFLVNGASLQFSVRDLDFFPDQFAPGVTLKESAALTAINGTQLANPIDFFDYLPRGTRVTSERLVTLNPISLTQPGMPEVNFGEPFVLSFTFTATVAVRGTRSYDLYNAPESIASDIKVSIVEGPPPVPEPSAIALAGVAGLMLMWLRWRSGREGVWRRPPPTSNPWP